MFSAVAQYHISVVLASDDHKSNTFLVLKPFQVCGIRHRVWMFHTPVQILSFVPMVPLIPMMSEAEKFSMDTVNHTLLAI